MDFGDAAASSFISIAGFCRGGFAVTDHQDAVVVQARLAAVGGVRAPGLAFQDKLVLIRPAFQYQPAVNVPFASGPVILWPVGFHSLNVPAR